MAARRKALRRALWNVGNTPTSISAVAIRHDLQGYFNEWWLDEFMNNDVTR